MKKINLDNIALALFFFIALLIGVYKSAKGQDPLYQHQLYKWVDNSGVTHVNGTGQSLTYLQANYGSTSVNWNPPLTADVPGIVDLNGDSVVNTYDLLIILGEYGNVLWSQSQFGCASGVGTYACWLQWFPDVQVGAVYHFPGQPFKMVQTNVGEWWWFENQ